MILASPLRTLAADFCGTGSCAVLGFWRCRRATLNLTRAWIQAPPPAPAPAPALRNLLRWLSSRAGVMPVAFYWLGTSKANCGCSGFGELCTDAALLVLTVWLRPAACLRALALLWSALSWVAIEASGSDCCSTSRPMRWATPGSRLCCCQLRYYRVLHQAFGSTSNVGSACCSARSLQLGLVAGHLRPQALVCVLGFRQAR